MPPQPACKPARPLAPDYHHIRILRCCACASAFYRPILYLPHPSSSKLFFRTPPRNTRTTCHCTHSCCQCKEIRGPGPGPQVLNKTRVFDRVWVCWACEQLNIAERTSQPGSAGPEEMQEERCRRCRYSRGWESPFAWVLTHENRLSSWRGEKEEWGRWE